MRTIIIMSLVGLVSLSYVSQQRADVPATQKSDETLGLRFQQTVDAMKSLHRGHEFPEHLLHKDAKKRGGEFDVQRYFTVLKHISMEKDYVLDYVYQYFEIGGRPVLYARTKTQPPYATEVDLKNAVRKQAHLDEVDAAYAEYRAATRNLGDDDAKARSEADKRLESRLAKIPDYDYWHWYLDHVRIDGTKEGYLEYVALFLLGRQFYLFWHEGYNDTRIVCDKTELNRILDEVAPAPPASSEPSKADSKPGEGGQAHSVAALPDWFVAETRPESGILPFAATTVTLDLDSLNPFSTKRLRAKALQLDPTPRVEIGDHETIVTIVTFSKWGGFARQQCTVSTRFPHKFLKSTRETLAEYQCGTNY